MTIKVAVAGTGYFSQFHLDAWRRLPEVKLVAACSLDPADPWRARDRAVARAEPAHTYQLLEARDLPAFEAWQALVRQALRAEWRAHRHAGAQP